MTMRPVKCGGCGERGNVKVLGYWPAVKGKPEHVGGRVQVSDGTPPEVRYECQACGVVSEHYTFPLTPEQLAALGYSC